MTASAGGSTVSGKQRYWRVSFVLLAALSFIEVVVVAAQFNLGRFVYAQPLRGPAVLSAAVVAIPLLLGFAIVRGTARVTDAATWAVRASLALCLLAALAYPVVYMVVTVVPDGGPDHDVRVVAIAPDRTFEVLSAVRYDDSGGYLILQARSRHGLFSRNAKYPFADICRATNKLEVTFDGPRQINVLVNNTLIGSVALNPRTLTAKGLISDCTGD